jgi:uncharacterized protein DUF4386
MTRPTTARIAGVTFLLYIAAGVSDVAIAPARLVSVLLSLIMSFSAVVLGVTLYRITCDEDADLATLALTCRVGEGLLAAMFIAASLAVQPLEATNAVRAFVLSARAFNVQIVATFFAVGSTLFSYLLLRGRLIPGVLAWLGVLASLLLVVGLPLQLGGVLAGPVTMLMWLPMLAFEVPLGLWLIGKGVATPRAPAP